VPLQGLAKPGSHQNQDTCRAIKPVRTSHGTGRSTDYFCRHASPKNDRHDPTPFLMQGAFSSWTRRRFGFFWAHPKIERVRESCPVVVQDSRADDFN